MSDPAFLFYTSDFYTGISDLTMEERGQYITMLCLQHQKGHLSEKTIRLNVGSVSDDVMVKFKKDEANLFYNQRLDIEIEKRAKYTDSRRNNASKGGRPKTIKEPYEKPYVEPLAVANGKDTENENENDNINTDKEEIKSKRKKFETPPADVVLIYFHEIAGDPKTRNFWPGDKRAHEAAKFYDHYTTCGWVQGKNKPIKDWKAAARNWIRNAGNFSAPVYTPTAPTAPAPVIPVEVKPKLHKTAEEINYLYERFCEDNTKITIISCDVGQYEYLKSKGLIKVSVDDKIKIASQADEKLKTMTIPAAEMDSTRLRTQKLFTIMHFFQKSQSLKLETIFSL